MPRHAAAATCMADGRLSAQASTKQGVRLADGSIIAFPYLPRVSELPPRWRHFSTAEKIKHLLGLDRCYEILSWPLAQPHRLRLSIKAQVIRIGFRICAKGMLHGTLGRQAARERERAEALKKLVRDLPGDEYGENRPARGG